MDPNATLAHILEMLTILNDNETTSPRIEARRELIEDLKDLTHWLENGGFPPRYPRW
jgi:hypothetical protein